MSSTSKSWLTLSWLLVSVFNAAASLPGPPIDQYEGIHPDLVRLLPPLLGLAEEAMALPQDQQGLHAAMPELRIEAEDMNIDLIREEPGRTLRYRFIKGKGVLRSLRVVEPEVEAGIAFHGVPNRPVGINKMLLRLPGRVAWELFFREDLLYLAEEFSPENRVVRVTAWNGEGRIVAQKSEWDPQLPEMAKFNAFAASLTRKQADLLGIKPKDQLLGTRAYLTAPFETKRHLEDFVGWASKFSKAQPEHIGELVKAQDIRKERLGEFDRYTIMPPPLPTAPLIVLTYDTQAGHMINMTRDKFKVNLRKNESGEVCLQSGLSFNRKQNTYLMAGFYPDGFTPRMAVALLPREEGANDWSASGTLVVWAPDGETLLSSDGSEAVPLAARLRRVESAVPMEALKKMGWAGAEAEAEALNGE